LINTINYGYTDDGDEHEMSVKITMGADEVYICIEDDGAEFNPLTVPAKKKSDPPPENEKGLGIHLIKNMMNAMTYTREEEKNILEIWIYF
jgi:serine/threonine-protein kinase RsbW